MARQKTAEPRSFLKNGGQYPFGPFEAGTPSYALAAAVFASNVIAYMDGSLSILGQEPSWIEQDRNMASLVKKAEIGQAVLSRILSGVGYPDLATIAKLEDFCQADLWGNHQERHKLASGRYDPSRRTPVNL